MTTIKEVMTRDVHLMRPDQSIREAAELMARTDVGSLPVSDDDRLIGMLTDRDLALRAVARGLGPETAVRDVMTADIKYCHDHEDVAHVAHVVTGDHQVEPSVIVVIPKPRGKASQRFVHPRAAGNLRELPWRRRRCMASGGSVIAKKQVGAVAAGDVDVGAAIVVVVTTCHAFDVANGGDS